MQHAMLGMDRLTPQQWRSLDLHIRSTASPAVAWHQHGHLQHHRHQCFGHCHRLQAVASDRTPLALTESKQQQATDPSHQRTAAPTQVAVHSDGHAQGPQQPTHLSPPDSMAGAKSMPDPGASDPDAVPADGNPSPGEAPSSPSGISSAARMNAVYRLIRKTQLRVKRDKQRALQQASDGSFPGLSLDTAARPTLGPEGLQLPLGRQWPAAPLGQRPAGFGAMGDAWSTQGDGWVGGSTGHRPAGAGAAGGGLKQERFQRQQPWQQQQQLWHQEGDRPSDMRSSWQGSDQRAILESDLTTDRSHLNPVYRLIRKKELQYRRDQAVQEEQRHVRERQRRQLMKKGGWSQAPGQAPLSGARRARPAGQGMEDDDDARDGQQEMGEFDGGSDWEPSLDQGPARWQKGPRAPSPGARGFGRRGDSGDSVIRDSDLASERSHMNPVYRLIRKKELQYRRTQQAGRSGAPGAPGAGWSASERRPWGRPAPGKWPRESDGGDEAWMLEKLRGPGPALGDTAAWREQEGRQRDGAGEMEGVTATHGGSVEGAGAAVRAPDGLRQLSPDASEAEGRRYKRVTPVQMGSATPIAPPHDPTFATGDDDGSGAFQRTFDFGFGPAGGAASPDGAAQAGSTMDVMPASDENGDWELDMGFGGSTGGGGGAVGIGGSSFMVQDSELATDRARLNPVFRLIRKKELQRRLSRSRPQAPPAPAPSFGLGGLESLMTGDWLSSSLSYDADAYLSSALDPGAAPPNALSDYTWQDMPQAGSDVRLLEGQEVLEGQSPPPWQQAQALGTEVWDSVGEDDEVAGLGLRADHGLGVQDLDMLTGQNRVGQDRRGRLASLAAAQESDTLVQQAGDAAESGAAGKASTQGARGGQAPSQDTAVGGASGVDRVLAPTGNAAVDRTIRIRQLLMRLRSKGHRAGAGASPAAGAPAAPRPGSQRLMQGPLSTAASSSPKVGAASGTDGRQGKAGGSGGGVVAPAAMPGRQAVAPVQRGRSRMPWEPWLPGLGLDLGSVVQGSNTSDTSGNTSNTSNNSEGAGDGSVGGGAPSPETARDLVPDATVAHEGVMQQSEALWPRRHTREGGSWRLAVVRGLTPSDRVALQQFQRDLPLVDLGKLLGIHLDRSPGSKEPALDVQAQIGAARAGGWGKAGAEAAAPATSKAPGAAARGRATAAAAAASGGETATEVATSFAERLDQLRLFLAKLGVPRDRVSQLCSQGLDTLVDDILVGKMGKAKSGAGDRIVRLAQTLGLETSEAVTLTRKQPNLLNRDLAALRANLDALSKLCNLKREAVVAMVVRYPALLEMSSASLQQRFQLLGTALHLDLSSKAELEQLVQAVRACPAWLGHEPDTVVAKVATVGDMLLQLVSACTSTGSETSTAAETTAEPEDEVAAARVLQADPAPVGSASVVAGLALDREDHLQHGLESEGLSGEGQGKGVGSASAGRQVHMTEFFGHSVAQLSSCRSQLAALMLLAFPGLLTLGSATLQSKVTRLATLVHGKPDWAEEVLRLSPMSLGRCLAASHKVLDRLSYFQETGVVPESYREGRNCTLLNLVVMSSAKFTARFPGFASHAADPDALDDEQVAD